MHRYIFRNGFCAAQGRTVALWAQGGRAGCTALPKLGKYREGVSCVYARRLSDVDNEVLGQLVGLALDDHKTRNEVTAQ